MSLTLKNVAINVAYYAATVIVGPWIALAIENRLGWPRHSTTPLRILAIVGAASGLALQVQCIILFQRIGRGTPSPAVPTARLVTVGPYRWVRNPMNIGDMMVFLAIAAWFGSLTLLLYALVAAFLFHVFIVVWEEPRSARTWAEDYSRYKSSTNRWVPGRPT